MRVCADECYYLLHLFPLIILSPATVNHAWYTGFTHTHTLTDEILQSSICWRRTVMKFPPLSALPSFLLTLSFGPSSSVPAKFNAFSTHCEVQKCRRFIMHFYHLAYKSRINLWVQKLQEKSENWGRREERKWRISGIPDTEQNRVPHQQPFENGLLINEMNNSYIPEITN